MKKRITLTIDPAFAQRAKKVARGKSTTVSGLVEDLLRSASLSEGEKKGSFVDRWAGRFTAADTPKGDGRMEGLKRKYGLEN